MAAGEFGYPFNPAHYYDARSHRNPLWIVIHCTGVHEHPAYAEDLGSFFSRPRNDGQQVSSHFGCDSNSTVQYVMTRDVAYCARTIGNEHGIHIELSGQATQSAAQWLDAFGQGLMGQAALLCSRLMGKYSIPLKWLTDSEVRGRGVKGFTTHAQLTRVFGGTHTDPGPSFPREVLFARIKSLSPVKPSPVKDDEMLRDQTVPVPAIPIALPIPAPKSNAPADDALGYVLARVATVQGEVANLKDDLNGAHFKLDQVIALLTAEDPA